MSLVVENEGFKNYVAGFVDGEGCFSASFRRLDRLKVKIETRVSFSIAQKDTKQNYVLLIRIRDLFKGGSIRKDNTGCYKYETRSVSHIMRNIVPFFKKYPLYTSKARDFNCFCEICSIVLSGQHLNTFGLIRVLKLAARMNPSGRRRYQLSSLQSFLESGDFG